MGFLETKMIRFEYVSPDQLRVGDILCCYRHDDQLEAKNARIVGLQKVEKKGVIFGLEYEYEIILTCRHVNVKRLDAEGGPIYLWHLYPWNGVTRYIF